MQNKIEMNKIELELLNLRLATAEAECDIIQKELLSLKLPQTKARPTGLWRRTSVTVVSVLVLSSLLSTSIFHDAQSKVKENNPTELPAITVLENGLIVHGELPTASSKKQSRYTRVKKASQRQWGPLLVMPEPGAKKRYYGFDPLVKEQQQNLLTLGFNIGKADGFKGASTQKAIAEFRALYLPDSAKQLKDANLAVVIENYANLARSDAARFGIDHGVVAAIRLSSVRTAVDFSYLMKLAATESNFKPRIKSATSSATGLYQFTHNTWLDTIKRHGAKYGLVADYAANIEYYETRYGNQRPIVRDKAMYKHLLALRKNPRLSAIMAAEMVRNSQQLLADSFGREPTQTDLYLTHFLGNKAAITFLQSLEQSPDAHAKELFPRAASSNRDIFHPKTSSPRTVDEVYALFGEKFTTSRFDDVATN